MRIYWDRGGRNVGRFQRFIYVEWEDPSDPYNRLLVVDASARPFVIATKWPYSLVDYTLYWKRVRRARLASRYRNFFLDAPGVVAEVDAVEIDAGSASLVVPRSVYERWLAMKGKLESMMQRIVQQMELEEARQRELRQRELRIVFE
jgi:hypothetical protein